MQDLKSYISKEELEEKGVEVVIAHDLKEVLEFFKTRKKKPTLIVTEIVLPIVNGYSILPLLQKKKVPIVVYTKLKGAGDLEKLVKLRVRNIFNKSLMKLEDLMKIALTFDSKKKSSADTFAMELQSQLKAMDEEKEESKLKVIQCPRCHAILPPNSRFCNKLRTENF